MRDTTRVLIAGGPLTGKSMLARTLSQQLGCAIFRTEQLLSDGYTWEQLARAAQQWLVRPGPWVMEGLTVARVIRRWYREHPNKSLPCDQVYWMGTEPRRTLRDGQVPVTKSVNTVWEQSVSSLMNDARVDVLNADGEILTC